MCGQPEVRVQRQHAQHRRRCRALSGLGRPSAAGPLRSFAGLREYLSEQHIRGWRADLGAIPTDVLDLLKYVQGGDRHKLGEMMATGSVTAQARLSSGGPYLGAGC